MFRLGIGFCLFWVLSFPAWDADAETKVITTRASCAIVEMTPEQARYLAKQRARTAAIEQAVGVQVASSSLVTDGKLAAEFIKTFSRGFIIREEVRWLPLTQYQKTPASPPIPEYGVELTATVFIPKKLPPSLGLKATLNRNLFRSGEKGILMVSTRVPARIGVFNLTADGRAVMLFPSEWEEVVTPGNQRAIMLPFSNSGMELVMVTLPDHQRDAEGFFLMRPHVKPSLSFLVLSCSEYAVHHRVERHLIGIPFLIRARGTKYRFGTQSKRIAIFVSSPVRPKSPRDPCQAVVGGRLSRQSRSASFRARAEMAFCGTP